MTTPGVAAALSFLGVAVTAAVTWYLGRRKSSGLINTTEAADLWEAAEEIRRELREEVKDLKNDLAATKEREQLCEQRVRALAEQLDDAFKRIRILEANA